MIWYNINKEWVDEQEEKEKKKMLKSQNESIKRKKRNKELVDPINASTALLEHSKIGKKLNPMALSELFNENSNVGFGEDGFGGGVKEEFESSGGLSKRVSFDDGGNFGGVMGEGGDGFKIGNDHADNVNAFKKLKLF